MTAGHGVKVVCCVCKYPFEVGDGVVMKMIGYDTHGQPKLIPAHYWCQNGQLDNITHIMRPAGTHYV